MKVDAKIVPSRDASGLLSPHETYELQMTIKFSEAEKVHIERVTLQDSLDLRRMDFNSYYQGCRWKDCSLEERDPARYDNLAAAQDALVDFMAAVADLLVREEAVKRENRASVPYACN